VQEDEKEVDLMALCLPI